MGAHAKPENDHRQEGDAREGVKERAGNVNEFADPAICRGERHDEDRQNDGGPAADEDHAEGTQELRKEVSRQKAPGEGGDDGTEGRHHQGRDLGEAPHRFPQSDAKHRAHPSPVR